MRPTTVHFTAAGGNEAGVHLVLIHPFFFIMLSRCPYASQYFLAYFHKKRKEVCIKTRSTSASRSLRGQGTKLTTVKWSIVSGIVTKDALISYWSIVFLSPVTVPGVFAKVNSTQFLLVLEKRQLLILSNEDIFKWTNKQAIMQYAK